jgi:hypothetical protein
MALISRSRGVARSICARKDRVIVRVCVAGRAHAAGVAVIDAPPCMAKRGACPRGCVVTGCASRRENRRSRLMDGVRGGVVIRRMTAVARRGQRGVVAIHMATGTSHRRMGAC